ncbi:MAG: siderophore-iron reductase FhuF [Pseudomonadota bacterium]
MIEALAPAFIGPFVYFARTAVLPDDPRPRINAGEFFEGPALIRSLELAQQRYPGGHRDAVTALWARGYAAKVVPVSLAASLILNRNLPVDIDQLELALGDDGASPAAIVVGTIGEPVTSLDAFARFARLIHGHLEPAVDALATRGRASRKVLWGDLALYIDYFLRASTEITDRPVGSFAFDPSRLVTARLLPDGRTNSLFQPRTVVTTPEGPALHRKTCCRSYRLGGDNQPCLDCPIQTKNERRAECSRDAA